MVILRGVVLGSALGLASGHGAMSFPRPRNALDGGLAPWTEWKYPCDATHQGKNCALGFCENGKDCQGSCAIPAKDGIAGELSSINGQSCYWFSNGCTAGCDVCDGTQNHVGHGMQSFRWNGMTKAELKAKKMTVTNPFNPEPGSMLLDLNASGTKGLQIKQNCDNPTKPSSTICASSLRTANTQAECGSPADFYYYSPWRSPGLAPVLDSCGAAGGRHKGQGIGGAGAQYQNTSLAKEGDLGSGLPAMEGTSWKAGASYEVGWVIAANHGGGYAYRLAPADAPLTEETFRKLPLQFEGESALRWDVDRNTQVAFDPVQKGWQTDKGTTPAGSQWRKNPIPSGLWSREGPQFEPVCNESQACYDHFTTDKGGFGVCRCSGYSNLGPLLPNVEIVDKVKVPEGLAPGRYVLQWRWDCEETDQIWASCADIEVTA